MPYHGVRGDFLLGMVLDGSDFSLEERTIGGCGFCVLTLPQGELRRQVALRRGVRALQKRQVRCCVFPDDFSEQRYFLNKGIHGVDAQPLLRKKAGQWVVAERQARELAGSVAVSCDRMTEDVANAVRFLLGKMMCVSLPPIRGAEELQREIRRDSGAVLRLLPAPRLAEAETLLDFSFSALEGQELTLRFGESELPRFLLPEDVEQNAPHDTHSAQLAAALWEMGRIETAMIGLKSRI